MTADMSQRVPLAAAAGAVNAFLLRQIRFVLVQDLYVTLPRQSRSRVPGKVPGQGLWIFVQFTDPLLYLLLDVRDLRFDFLAVDALAWIGRGSTR